MNFIAIISKKGLIKASPPISRCLSGANDYLDDMRISGYRLPTIHSH